MPPINAWNVVDKYELAEILSHWHGGQDDPIYSVSSSIGGNEHNLTKKIVQDALWNLNHDYRQAAKRHFKGISRGDAAELRYGIDMLQQVYDKMPDDGSEDMEPNGSVPIPVDGYAYGLTRGNWQTAKDDNWDTLVIDPSDGPFDLLGRRNIDDVRCNVWKSPSGIFAQMQHMSRNCSRNAGEVRPYLTSYCNQPHDLSTGKPIGHGCHVIPPAALAAERQGDYEGAIELIQKGKKYLVYGEKSLKPHSGMRGT